MINTSRSLVISKIAASAISFVWLGVLTNALNSSNLGTVFECLFISQSLVFLTDQGLTATLLRRQSSGNNLQDDLGRINRCLKIRALRTALLVPVLFVLLHLLTDASGLAVIAVILSHVATLTYSTINAGLLGANLRYVEAIAEPGSRSFLLATGTLGLLISDQFGNSQSIIFLYAGADIFMLLTVFMLLRNIYSKVGDVNDSDFVMNRKYQKQSTITGATLSTVGLGETWALSIRSTTSDFAFYGLITRVIDISGYIATYAGYSHLPQLVGAVQEQNWNSLLARVRRIVLFSLIPTALLSTAVVAAGVTGFSFRGYDIAGKWFPLLALVLSTPTVVMSRYLMQTIANTDPKALRFVTVVTGTAVTVGVIGMYEVFGLSGTLIVISLTNIARGLWLSLLAKRFNSVEILS